jgi:flagellin
MSSVINTNISALSAQASLRRSALDSSTAMERLSTGIRINSAKDDAAGLAISTRMTANIRGMAAAIRNSNDGISLTQTAEGSLSAIQNNLQRIRELAVQSANSGNSQSDRNSMNLEAQQMITEIDRVASNSAFNGSKLLDGTFKDQSFQVGSGNDTTDRISISIGNAKASALGVVGATTGTSTFETATIVGLDALAAGDIGIKGYAISATSSDGVSYKHYDGSAIAKANAINASSSLTGVSAKASATSVTTAAAADAFVAVSAGSLLINGVDIGPLSEADDAQGRADQLVAAINAKSSQTGVVAKNNVVHTDKVDLTAADGRNITTTVTDAAITATTGGLHGVFATVGDETTTAKLNITSATGETAVAVTGTTAGLAATSLSTSNAMTTSPVLGQTVSSVDLSSQENSQKALSILDAAIDTVTNSRANLGAYQNRFEAAISNLETSSTNLQASRSRILDTDYAKETTNLAKSQIVQQAATAMLAQANQSSQSVLALLK